MLRVLSLFAGIGAFDLGLEATGGFRTVAFCEIDPFCRSVLRRHWSDVPQYRDVRNLTADCLRADGIDIDVIAGGFPCQDISLAGSGAGLAGERSGLWREFARLIGELRPRYAIVENTAALLARGLGDLLGDLATLGYDAEWDCIPASSVGAPHIRDRVWIVAYPDSRGRREQGLRGEAPCAPDAGQSLGDGEVRQMADAASLGCGGRASASSGRPDAGRQWSGAQRSRGEVAVAGGARLSIGPRTLAEWAYATTSGSGRWATESGVCRVVDGLADRLDRRKRLMALGNSLVPVIPEILGKAILEADELAD